MDGFKTAGKATIEERRAKEFKKNLEFLKRLKDEGIEEKKF